MYLHLVSPITSQKIIFVLGIVNAATVVALFSTCRCFAGWKIGARLTKHQWFKRYFKFHCYLWWVLLTSVVVHAFFAINYLGFPF